MEKFNADCVSEKREDISRVKTPKQKLTLPVVPESGHNSTWIYFRFHGSFQWTGERREVFNFPKWRWRLL